MKCERYTSRHNKPVEHVFIGIISLIPAKIIILFYISLRWNKITHINRQTFSFLVWMILCLSVWYNLNPDINPVTMIFYCKLIRNWILYLYKNIHSFSLSLHLINTLIICLKDKCLFNFQLSFCLQHKIILKGFIF